MLQYQRVLDLVEYFETVVKNQSGVIAFQEKIISKLSMRLNAIKVEENYHQKAIAQLKKRDNYNEKEVNAIFSSMPKVMYKYEPFEFYGGNFQASQIDK